MSWKHTLLFSFQSLGVIYGQISTAPLYVFGTIAAKDIKSEEAVYELFSFIFWTMTTISLLKYCFIVLKADDHGEGKLSLVIVPEIILTGIVFLEEIFTPRCYCRWYFCFVLTIMQACQSRPASN